MLGLRALRTVVHVRLVRVNSYGYISYTIPCNYSLFPFRSYSSSEQKQGAGTGSSTLPTATSHVDDSTSRKNNDHGHNPANQYNIYPNEITLKNNDISGLPARLKNQMMHYKNGVMGTAGKKHLYHFGRNYQKQMFAKHGNASPVFPGVLWPTKLELQSIIEDEKEDEYYEDEGDLLARLQKLQSHAANEKRRAKELDDLVDKQMQKMPEYIAAYKQKLRDEQEVVAQQENRKKELMEEAREYFGYDVDPGDPRFVRMQENKLEQEKKLLKQKRKELKAERLQESVKRMQEQAKKEREQLEADLAKKET